MSRASSEPYGASRREEKAATEQKATSERKAAAEWETSKPTSNLSAEAPGTQPSNPCGELPGKLPTIGRDA